LTHRLIDEARGNRVRSFYALVKAGNERMLNVLRHLRGCADRRVANVSMGDEEPT
jgi:hypothetical protein